MDDEFVVNLNVLPGPVDPEAIDWLFRPVRQVLAGDQPDDIYATIAQQLAWMLADVDRIGAFAGAAKDAIGILIAGLEEATGSRADVIIDFVTAAMQKHPKASLRLVRDAEPPAP